MKKNKGSEQKPLIEQRHYDPMLMDAKTLSGIFNEVVNEVAPKEGIAYMKAVTQLEGVEATNDDYRNLDNFIENICQTQSLAVSILVNVFNRSENEVSAESLREFFNQTDDQYYEHYMGQKIKSDSPSVQENAFNASLALHAATSRAFLKRLAVRVK